MQKSILLALAAWLVVYGLVLSRRLIVSYRRAIRIFDDTHADDMGAYIKWLSVFTYWAPLFGIGCGLLTFLPDEYVYIWILSSIPFLRLSLLLLPELSAVLRASGKRDGSGDDFGR